jgi:septal ring factor EnvC (AmiA/AmiB activator)
VSEGKTAGQLAFEAYVIAAQSAIDEEVPPWGVLGDRAVDGWEAAAAAGAAPARERTAELLGEVNELRERQDKLADELQKAEATIADYRDALCAMQAERDRARDGTGHLAERITRLAIPETEG